MFLPVCDDPSVKELFLYVVSQFMDAVENQQLQTDARLVRENNQRSHHDYKIGQKVYVNNHFSSSDKMKPAWKGPFPILQVHTNGTITIQRGQVHERILIRRCKPA